MVIQFTLQPESPANPAHDDGRARKRATVFSFLTATTISQGTVRRSRPGHCSRRSGLPELRGDLDPWDGGDAA
jgi:hypothetical protein